jgi:predicted RecA/RadA family phage recombinase
VDNYVQDGNVINHVAAAALTSGVMFRLGTLLAVPVTDAAIGEEVAVRIGGVTRLPKVTATVMAQGDSLDFDASEGKLDAGITPAAGDLENCCVVTQAADGSATEVEVLLNVAGGAAT